MSPAADRNLLFGILALQMDFITREQLVAAMNAWVLAKAKPLGEILRQHGALSHEHHELLAALVQAHLKNHKNDPEQSLAAVPVSPWLKDQIQSLCHPDLEASLGQLGGAAADDGHATRSFTVGQSSSLGSRFRIVRPHAEGGLGRVSVAHDEELHREVALKEIKERHADDPGSRGRFVLEAEITGRLEHPGIVPVYGLGNYGDGRPFYAMRFIKGDSLKEAIERFHQCDGRASRRKRDVSGGDAVPVALTPRLSPDFTGLEFRQLLGRFVDVCNAIAYAHSRGVMHRDLKPGNIMLGKYGETLVVDWGLAKAVGRSQSAGGSQEPGKPEGAPSSLGSLARDPSHIPPSSSLHDEAPLTPSGSDYAETVAGTALGTPAFMSPEQAAGRLDLLGPASDIYSLGATLYTVLTNRAPVRGDDTPEILRKVQAGDIDWQVGQNRSSIPRALIAICQKAMALRPADRYATPLALAEDLEHWLADEPVSAYREPWTKRLARWRRRHHTLVTASALVLITLIVGGGVGRGLLEREKTQTRVLGQIDALTDAAAGAVPALLADLARNDVAAFARTRVRERWADPSLSDRQRLRMGLALADARVPADAATSGPNAATGGEVHRRLIDLAQKADDPQEVLLVRDALKTSEVASTSEVLWQRSQDASLPRVERLRLWAMLATLDPDGAGWKEAAESLVNELFAANPLHLGVWQQAFAPVRQALLPVLQKAYRDPTENRRQLAAALLADYASDRPQVLTDLLLDADAKQFPVVYAVAAGKLPARTLLAELDKKPAPPPAPKEILKKEGSIAADDPQVKTSGGQTMPAKVFEATLQAGVAYKIGIMSKDGDSFVVVHDSAGKEPGFDDDSGGALNRQLELTPPRTESYKIYAALLPNKNTKSAGAFVLTITETVAASGPLAVNLPSRQANAAVALLRLGQADKVWPLLKHSPDPSVRSYLIHRLGPQGVDADAIVKRFNEERHVSTRRALLLALGAYTEPRTLVSGGGGEPLTLRGSLTSKLLDLYRTDADAGLHAAAGWLLTHWGHKEKLLAIDRELATTDPPIKNRQSKIENPTWWVNSQGQTMIVIPGPVEFLMGASAGDPECQTDEVRHLRRIKRSFALAAHSVTVEQFLKYRKDHNYLKKHAPTPDCPVHGATWYEAAGYCNWVSEQEKIPEEQWCYETNVAGQVVKLKENYLSLTGYRLPTEAEMEYACRAKAGTSRYYGDQEELLDKYAWFIKNGQDRSWPVGLLKPNDFGFFDLQGNVWNWCQERYKGYPRPKADEPVEDSEHVLTINNQDGRVLRGGSFNDLPGYVRSSNRLGLVPSFRIFYSGFRPSRTLP